mmetsp:Transcript_6446/g.20588  ORF Transcript_6446/g.20588 Transcript_6446/m.20588 type:complete len:285 (+) Transcript_6446:95-949(+)
MPHSPISVGSSDSSSTAAAVPLDDSPSTSVVCAPSSSSTSSSCIAAAALPLPLRLPFFFLLLRSRGTDRAPPSPSRFNSSRGKKLSCLISSSAFASAAITSAVLLRTLRSMFPQRSSSSALLSPTPRSPAHPLMARISAGGTSNSPPTSSAASKRRERTRGGAPCAQRSLAWEMSAAHMSARKASMVGCIAGGIAGASNPISFARKPGHWPIKRPPCLMELVSLRAQPPQSSSIGSCTGLLVPLSSPPSAALVRLLSDCKRLGQRLQPSARASSNRPRLASAVM